MPLCFPTPDYALGFYLSPRGDATSHTQGISFKSWGLSYPLISLSKTFRLPFCILYPPQQDEAMSKPLVRLLLSPPDLLLSYRPTQVLSWSDKALAQRLKEKCFRASKMSLVSPVSPPPGISIQDEGKKAADLASPVIKIAFAVHALSWKYHHKQDTYHKIAMQRWWMHSSARIH